jgi:hypothetical protein
MDTEPLDPHVVAKRLSRAPFVTIDGVYNARDLGLLLTTDDTNESCSSDAQGIRSGFAFRSGEVSGITETGT